MKNESIQAMRGRAFGHFTVLEYAYTDAQRSSHWQVQCDCGHIKTVSRSTLSRSTLAKRCGCRHDQRLTHGQARSRKESTEYQAFKRAKSRCKNPNNKNYGGYGDRGIEFRFDSFEDFYQEIGDAPPKASIDRIDNDGHYEKGNVRWVTQKEQCRNKRNNILITIANETQCAMFWIEKFNLPFTRIYARLKRGWCGSCSILLPVGQKCTHKEKQ